MSSLVIKRRNGYGSNNNESFFINDITHPKYFMEKLIDLYNHQDSDMKDNLHFIQDIIKKYDDFKNNSEENLFVNKDMFDNINALLMCSIDIINISNEIFQEDDINELENMKISFEGLYYLITKYLNEKN